MMDKDGDGQITADELIEATKTENIGLAEAKKMIAEVRIERGLLVGKGVEVIVLCTSFFSDFLDLV